MEEQKKPKIKEKLNILCKLFSTFFKLGLICFGGGYAMIALIEKEVCEKKEWLSKEEVLDIVALSETTPGPIAVNMATFVGTKKGGFWGAAAATLGVALPSFIIIFALSFFIEAFKELTYVAYAFKGIRAAVLVLILSAVIKFFKELKKTPLAAVIMLGALAVTLLTNFSAIYVLLIAAAIGIAVAYILRFAEKRKTK